MNQTKLEFSGECIAVTGAASGIGAAVTRQLLAQGARVIALDLDAEGLTRLGDADSQERLSCHLVDVSNAQAVNLALDQGQAKLGAIQRLACVAGMLQMGRIAELSNEQWDRVFAVNTTGVFNVCRHVAQGMMERRQGAIVTVSSNSAATPRIAMGAYAASKAAVTQLSRCLGLELAEYGIRVNIVSPGSTDTAMQQAMWKQGSSRETVIAGSGEHYRLGIPLQKIATPDEVAQAVLFLLSDRASHITLSDLRVDGGATLDQG
ncbi:2,3-dihydro-2,3-dihydroxybenzoate dehydrogenase [Alcaligenes sp. SDU_A2]|uniref:2,3-dihydro-2,3-dihydroxybenzoate dehydrogenase n=1 Tax=Alcaligenes sp. SDU_A2 TaxID=3136634 RepID=UPI00311DA5D0